MLSTHDRVASTTFGMMKFAQQKHQQYGLQEVTDIKDFESKLDKAIKDVSNEVNLQKAKVESLRAEYERLLQAKA